MKAPKTLGTERHRTQRRTLSARFLTERTHAARGKGTKVSFFGNFGLGNLGNESTLQAMLYHVRRLVPDAEVTCICTDPEAVTARYGLAAIPACGTVVKRWSTRNPLLKLMRKLFVGIPSELYRWLKCNVALRYTDMLIVPGTGLLTDAYGLMNDWGPYSMFKWSLAAKLNGCKLIFVSVGAGPLYGHLSRCFVKSALALADSRSYRDASTRDYLEDIGFIRNNDRVYPDLVFSLPESIIPHENGKATGRAVVGLGIMEYAGKYSIERPSTAVHSDYLEKLAILVEWLLAREYNVRLLIGDTCDKAVTDEFSALLKVRLSAFDASRIIDEPAVSVEHLLLQLACTDIVVATRFHTVLSALLLNKPVISISFHHKCSSLMAEMGLGEYCQDINHLDCDKLIEQFCGLERNVEKVKVLIKRKAGEFRNKLDEQYEHIFGPVDAHEGGCGRTHHE
jgi:polysaccharide pyruvyl transferase WcaK-like protein